MKAYFYGIRGVECVRRGEWGDPELIWHKKSFNYYDVENTLRAEYCDECRENGTKPNDDEFPLWVKKNAYLVRDILQHLLDEECFC